MVGARLSAYSSSSPPNNCDSGDWDFIPPSCTHNGFAGAKYRSASSAAKSSESSFSESDIFARSHLLRFLPGLTATDRRCPERQKVLGDKCQTLVHLCGEAVQETKRIMDAEERRRQEEENNLVKLKGERRARHDLRGHAERLQVRLHESEQQRSHFKALYTRAEERVKELRKEIAVLRATMSTYMLSAARDWENRRGQGICVAPKTERATFFRRIFLHIVLHKIFVSMRMTC
jgi:hypothetical protein